MPYGVVLCSNKNRGNGYCSAKSNDRADILAIYVLYYNFKR